jgi:hypothetical protein
MPLDTIGLLQQWRGNRDRRNVPQFFDEWRLVKARPCPQVSPCCGACTQGISWMLTAAGISDRWPS